MADKKQNSTLILKVDLDCNLCYKKIKKVLCKLQEKEDIKAIIYDEKSKSIMLSGPFNPDKVSNWLCCRACKVIKEIEIKDGKPKDSKPADDAKPKGDKPKGDKPKDDKPKDGKAQNGKSKDEKPKSDKAQDGKPKDEKPKGDKAKNSKPDGEIPKGDMPKEKMPKMVKFDSNPIMIPQKAQLEPLKNEFGVVGGYPQMSYQPGWPVGPVASMGSMGSMGPMGPAAGACCYRPLYEGFYGGCRCCSCGTVQGYGVAAPPVGYYGGPAPVDPYKSSQYFCEEEPTCSIM